LAGQTNPAPGYSRNSPLVDGESQRGSFASLRRGVPDHDAGRAGRCEVGIRHVEAELGGADERSVNSSSSSKLVDCR
jgi:hypothetical protein